MQLAPERASLQRLEGGARRVHAGKRGFAVRAAAAPTPGRGVRRASNTVASWAQAGGWKVAGAAGMKLATAEACWPPQLPAVVRALQPRSHAGGSAHGPATAARRGVGSGRPRRAPGPCPWSCAGFAPQHQRLVPSSAHGRSGASRTCDGGDHGVPELFLDSIIKQKSRPETAHSNAWKSRVRRVQAARVSGPGMDLRSRGSNVAATTPCARMRCRTQFGTLPSTPFT